MDEVEAEVEGLSFFFLGAFLGFLSSISSSCDKRGVGEEE